MVAVPTMAGMQPGGQTQKCGLRKKYSRSRRLGGGLQCPSQICPRRLERAKVNPKKREGESVILDRRTSRIMQANVVWKKKRGSLSPATKSNYYSDRCRL